MVDENGARELEQAVQELMDAGGVRGTVTVTGRTMSLRTGGAPVDIDALYLLEQWPLLPEEMRKRKAADIAERLLEARKTAKAGTLPSATPQKPKSPSIRPIGAPARGPRKPIVLPIGAMVLLGLIGAFLYFWLKANPRLFSSQAPTASAPPETSQERDARLCEAARKSVLTTQRLPQLDSQVWLVELWLATSKTGDSAARSKKVNELLKDGKLTAAADPDLAAIREGKVEIVRQESAPGIAWSSMHVRFHGGYVTPFFEDEGRKKLSHIAELFANATEAEMGALYGRCAHLRFHDIGAWFRGSSPALASGALVYSMGFFSERRLTNRDPSSPPTASDLSQLVGRTDALDKTKIESAIREAGGTLTTGEGDTSIIQFPLQGPTRASRASGLIADAAKIGANAPRTTPTTP